MNELIDQAVLFGEERFFSRVTDALAFKRKKPVLSFSRSSNVIQFDHKKSRPAASAAEAKRRVRQGRYMGLLRGLNKKQQAKAKAATKRGGLATGLEVAKKLIKARRGA